MSTIQRITGTNSGLDVDALVKSAMTTYTTKVDKETQNKKVLEYQQEQYKKIMSDASDFYDKYFDILKTGNLMMTSSYQTESFTSSDSSKVIAKGFAGASIDNYTVNVTQLASKATSILADGATGNKTMTFGSGANLVTLDAFAVGSDAGKTAAENAATTIANYNTKLTAKKAELNNAYTTANAADKLIIQQKLKSLNVTATYSEFNKGIVFTADQMGEGGFTLDGSSAVDKELQGTITKGGTSYTLSGTSNTVNIDNVQFTLKGVTSKTSNITSSSITNLLEEHISNTSYTLSNGRKITIGNDGTTTIDASFVSNGKTFNTDGSITSSTQITTGSTSTSITSLFGDNITKTLNNHDTANNTDTAEYTLNNGVKIKICIDNNTPANSKVTIMDGENALDSTDTVEFTNTDGTKMTIKGDGTVTNSTQITSSSINKLLEENNLSVSDTVYTLDNTDSNKIKIASDGTIKIMESDGTTEITDPIELTNDDGSIIKINKDGTLTTNGTDNSVTLTGSTDVTALKDKIVNFVNDYNTLLKSINTKLFEKRDKDYMPLTDEQKKAMSEDQITSWEKKSQTGLLRRDSDLERIANAMKSAMSSVMSGSGSYLEQMGITPVKDYTDKNGMFTINEDKLTKALEENATNVKDLFTRDASTTDKGGVLTQLAAALKSEFKTSTSSLAKKAGLVGSSTEYDNTLTKSISEKTALIKKLNTQLSTKETALYKKYSDLETIMGKLNSQQSSLASMLGQA
ncbi:MAG: flagellar filament capping protein FliD [Clostridium sp.]|uniref:flagellar filament capping protein FliD n=1 Tax=Clostridium sp. TaxID=1506 RepID=UPI0025C158E9|nr:flagellar filament capping protein FliD [Clostridium sp.]MCE5220771.1 flagellar filament capping protein FliD [Clostridium sp.]